MCFVGQNGDGAMRVRAQNGDSFVHTKEEMGYSVRDWDYTRRSGTILVQGMDAANQLQAEYAPVASQ